MEIRALKCYFHPPCTHNVSDSPRLALHHSVNIGLERSEPIRTRSETKLVFVRMFAFIYLATVPTPLLPSSDRGNNPLRINRLRPWPTPDLASVHALERPLPVP